MQVCADEEGRAFAGAEDPVRYEQNPGEGWAEAYRVLTSASWGCRRARGRSSRRRFYPTAAALTAAEQDVMTPWQTGATTLRTAR